jgi:hypothetical protein
MTFNPAAFYSQDIVGARAATRTLLQRIALVAPISALRPPRFLLRTDFSKSNCEAS